MNRLKNILRTLPEDLYQNRHRRIDPQLSTAWKSQVTVLRQIQRAIFASGSAKLVTVVGSRSPRYALAEPKIPQPLGLTNRAQCDGSSPCSRCRADNAICVFGDRKKSHDKIYPKGYVDFRPCSKRLLIDAIADMLRCLSSNNNNL